MLQNLSPESIQKRTYTDFVGLINQTNVPPGSYATITRWAVNGFVGPSSHIVEVACTTGFSLREICRLTGATGEGVDLSAASIESARANASAEVAAKRLRFQSGDATQFLPERQASHVIVGAALGFFPQPEVMIQQMTKYWGAYGTLLASPFYATSEIPAELVREAQSILGIVPTTASYKQVMSLYRGFQVRFEEKLVPEPETRSELKHYCDSTIERSMKNLGESRSEIYDVMYKRLFAIKDVCNRLRRHQGYSVAVFGYDSKEFGKRYVELF